MAGEKWGREGVEGDGDSHVMARVWIAEGMVGYSKVCLFLYIGWEAIGGNWAEKGCDLCFEPLYFNSPLFFQVAADMYWMCTAWIIMLRALCTLTYLILKPNLWGRDYQPQSTDDKTELQQLVKGP